MCCEESVCAVRRVCGCEESVWMCGEGVEVRGVGVR